MKLLCFLLLLSFSAFTCDINGKTGIMPENDMYIGVDSFESNGMTEKTFNSIIDKVEKVYTPIVKENGGRLKVYRKWSDGTVNAYAKRSLFTKTWQVHMFGGLARHKAVTEDAFALVVCHELGHHLGGAPKVSSFVMSWASNEGQSDYFATLKCFRKVFGQDDNIALTSKMTIDPQAISKCEEIWSSPADAALCKRAAMAAKSLATLLGRGKKVAFNTPDKSIVTKTNDKHPQGQCRLDTYFQGSICTVDHNEDVSQKDYSVGTCTRANEDSTGTRPLCWFKPSKS